MLRYLAGLITAALAGVAGVWLILAPAALGYPGHGVYTSMESRVSLGTGAGLCVVALISAVCWSVAWRRRLRCDGVLPGNRSVPVATLPSEEAPTEVFEPVPAPGSSDDPGLRALLAPLVSALAADGADGSVPGPDPARPVDPPPAPAPPAAAVPSAVGGLKPAPAGSAMSGSAMERSAPASAGSVEAGSALGQPAPATVVAEAGPTATAPPATPFGAGAEPARRDAGSQDLAWQDAVLREAAREAAQEAVRQARPPLPRRETGRATIGRYGGTRAWGGSAVDDAEETW